MSIPDTPEQLFEQLAEPTLHEVFPDYYELSPVAQKLVRLLHTELAKGTLTDGTLQEFVSFTLHLWRSFNAGAMQRMDEQLDTEPEIESDWIRASSAMHRMDQYLTGLLVSLGAMPPEDPDNPMSAWSHYYLRPSAD
jgi:hypothetical protein